MTENPKQTSAAAKIAQTLLVITLAAAVILFAARMQGLSSFVFAWVFNFMLMMTTLTLMQAIKPKLSSSFYQTKRFEQGGRIYRFAGVAIFRKLLVLTGWEKLNKAANPVSKKLDHIRHLEYTTRQSEFGHWVIGIIVLVLAIIVWYFDRLSAAKWLLILNVPLNIYPIIVQRYNRPRYAVLLRRMEGW